MEVLLAACCVGALQGSVVWREDYFDQAYDVVTDGNTAYVAARDSGVLVVNITNESAPMLLGVCQTRNRASNLQISGSLLYVADSYGGLAICDVTDLSTPNVVGTLDCVGNRCVFWSVDVVGTTVYVGDRMNMHIIDASDPTTPKIVGTYAGGHIVRSIQVVGSHAYVGIDTVGLHIVDVADPTTPTRVGVMGGIDAQCVLVSGTVVYVGAGEVNEIRTVDITDLTTPVLLGSIVVPDAPRDLALHGSMLYVACSTAGVQVVDVTTPATPTITSTYPTSKSTYSVAHTEKTTLLATSLGVSLYIIDVETTPATPTQVAVYGDHGAALSVDTEGTVAVVCGYNSNTIRLYNVADTSSPRLLSVLNIGKTPERVYITGGMVYVGIVGELMIIDVSNPSSPWITGSATSLGGRVYDLSVKGGKAYVLVYWTGLVVVDVSDPAAPVEVGKYGGEAAPGSAMAMEGTIAYVASPDGVVAVDVVDPTNPTLLGTFDTPARVYDVKPSGGILYLAVGYHGLVVVDAKDATDMVQVGNYTLRNSDSVSIVGGVAYLADKPTGVHMDYSSIRIFDVSDPTSPTLLNSVHTDGSIRDVHAVGTTVYIAAHGLRIIDVAAVPQPTPIEGVPPKSSGDDDDTDIPFWVWILVAVGVLGVCGGVIALYLAQHKNPADNEKTTSTTPDAAV